MEGSSTPKLSNIHCPFYLIKKYNTLKGLSIPKLTKYIDLSFIKKKLKEIKTHIIKAMRNQFTEYKTLLQTFSPEEQIVEINDMIKSLVNKKHIANIKDRRYDRIKELKHMRDNIINNM